MIEFLKFLINLDERPDRLADSIIELKKLNLSDVIRFPAIKASPGLHGCLLSHMYCLAIARYHQKSAMIFEDDFKLINEYDEILPAALQELESRDWALFYLGGNICDTITPETKHLGRLSWCQSTHAMCINLKYIDQILLSIPSGYGLPLDMIYTKYIIPYTPCYITIPKMIAVQRKSYSDIEGQEVEYESWMEKRYFSNLAS